MYSSVRRYTANPGLADKFKARGDEIKKVIQGISGVTAYYLIKTPDGAIAVTICDDKRSAEKSNEVAADWIRKNMATVVSEPPTIHQGEVLIHTMAKAGAMR